MLSRSYELSLSKDYVKHWGMVEGVRELLQNAIDSDSPFEWEFIEDKLLLHSRFSKLEPKTLLLGTSHKTDNSDYIGNFGEGYKIAMLVLTRLGYGVKIYNGRNIWTPEFRFNRKYESDMLYVISTTASIINEGVTFEVSGLSESDFNAITDVCLHLQNEIGEIKQTQYGRILINKPGRLYVSGLFICTTDLSYGYDIDSKYINLERDRQTVSNWELKEITAKMWFDTKDMDMVAKLMAAKIPDLDDAEYGSPELVREACYKHFRSKHKDEVIAKDQAELEQMVRNGMTAVVYDGGYGSSIRRSRFYIEDTKNLKTHVSVNEEMETWFKDNKQYMRKHAIVSFKKLITESKKWKR